jgi:hypothetical protein
VKRIENSGEYRNAIRQQVRKLLVCECGHSKYHHVCNSTESGCLICACRRFDYCFYKGALANLKKEGRNMAKQKRASGNAADRLPGTYGGIEELDAAGLKLKAVRTERMALSKKEAEAADECLKVMKKHNQRSYHYGEVDLEIVPGKEKVSTAAKKDEED